MMTNPCMACQHRARLREQLQSQLTIHMREIESLYRDIEAATSHDLPEIQAEVERIVGRVLTAANLHPTPTHTGRTTA
jgi:hypothetical protein